MKHNANKNKINFRSVYVDIWYSKRKKAWIIEYFYADKLPVYFRNPKHHRNRKQACEMGKNPKTIVSNYDDIRLSRNYRSWKDRTKRKHQYKNENNDDFKVVHNSGNI